MAGYLSQLKRELDTFCDEILEIIVEVYKQLKKDLSWYIAIVALFYFLINASGFNKDDTDGEKRSGMKPLIDARTGCQYLASNGGITPRLDKNGKQICGI